LQSNFNTIKLMRNKNITEVGSMSDGTRPAQSPKLCCHDQVAMAEQRAVNAIARCRQTCSLRDVIVLDLLLGSGLRVSEICSLEPRRILNDKQVLVKGAKGSGDRVCTLRWSEGLQYFQGAGWSNFSYGLDRYYIYRLCRKMGVYAHIIGNKNQAVTHAGRHQYVAQLEKQGLTPEEIKTVIGHKSVKSTMHYLEHKPKTC